MIIIYKVAIKFYNDRCFIISYGLAFKTIFALIPISVIFIGVYALFPTFDQYRDRIVEVASKLLPDSVNIVVDWMNHFISNTGKISILGTIALIYLSLDLFITLDSQLNTIWASRIKRSFIQKFLIYWAILTASPILLAGWFYYSGVVRSLINPIIAVESGGEWYFSLIIFLILTFFFFFILYAIPNIKVHIMKAITVSFIISIFWSILRFLFSYYTRFAIVNWKIYGSLAAIIFFMIWISFNWMILLFGVEFLQVWQEKLYIHDVKFKKFFLYDLGFTLLILKELHEDFSGKGEGVRLDLLAEKLKYNLVDLIKIVRLLEEEGIVVEAKNKYIYLKRNLSLIKLERIEKLVWKRLIAEDYRYNTELQNICDNLSSHYFRHSMPGELFVNEIISDNI